MEYEPKSMNVQTKSGCEEKEMTEPHLENQLVKPEHLRTCKKEGKGFYDLQLQVSTMAARETKLCHILRDTEEALTRQQKKHSLDQLTLISLEKENAKLVGEMAQTTAELNTQEQVWQEKFYLLKSLNNVLLYEREKAWGLERAALETKIVSLQKGSEKKQRTFWKGKKWLKKIAKQMCK